DVSSRLRDMTICHCLIKCVIRGAGERNYVALSTRSMGLETLDHIVSVGAEGEHECVVAGAAVEGETYRSGGQRDRIDGIIAGAAFDHQMIAKITALSMVDRNLSRQPPDRDQSTGSRDVDVVVAVGPIDRHGVGRTV